MLYSIPMQQSKKIAIQNRTLNVRFLATVFLPCSTSVNYEQPSE